MKKNIIILFIGIIVGVIIYFSCNYFFQQKNESNYGLIKVITYDRFTTLMNDGGSHFDRKYIVDLNKKELKKYEDYYKGFEGYQYQDKLLYEKKLNSNDVKKIRLLIEDIINNKDQYEKDTERKYIFYTISSETFEEIKIYDSEIIKKIENIFAQ